MRTLHALREQRASKIDAIKAIHAKATTENRDFSDAEQSAFDAGRGEIDGIEKEIRNAEFLANVERHAEADPVSGSRDMAELERRFSIGKALGEFSETGRLTGLEAEYAAEHRSGRPNAFSAPVSLFLGESRAVLTTTPVAGPGGNLVSRTLGPLINLKRPTLAVQAAGATVLSGLTGNLDLPRLTGSGTAYWVPEHTDVTVSDPIYSNQVPSNLTKGTGIGLSALIYGVWADLILAYWSNVDIVLNPYADSVAKKGGAYLHAFLDADVGVRHVDSFAVCKDIAA